MKLAVEWFLNPDHLPIIVSKEKGYLKEIGIDEFEIIVPTEHYDGLQDLIDGNIQFATNEPLHLIEQYHEEFLSLGTYFETKGGVMMKKEAFEKLKRGENIKLVTPVSNDKTNKIGFEIISRYCQKHGFEVEQEQVKFCAEDFYLIKLLKSGYDAAWLYFYNFEGIESKYEDGLDMIFMDTHTAGFANFCALDIFTTHTFYSKNQSLVEKFVVAIRKGIEFIEQHPQEAYQIYYAYAQEEPSELTEEIMAETSKCFRKDFKSSAERELPILEFFNEIGITDLPEEKFRKAFIN
jgi:putative hydroxymethylpyrimidine transport system substrate-binding protein